MQASVCVAGNWRRGVASTADSGETWQVRTVPPLLSSPSEVAKLRFISPHDGWLYNHHAVLVTHDGGTTWTDDPHLPGALTIEAAGDDLWAIEGFCGYYYPCDYRLVSSADAGATWQPAIVPPAILGGLGGSVGLIKAGPQDAWIVSVTGKGSAALIGTHDGGATWDDLTLPCSGFEGLPAVAATDAAHLWLLCSGQPGAGNQAKWLYKSSDGGAQWRLVAETAWLERAGLRNLPTGGYARQLVATSDQKAFMGLGRGQLWMTRDGGQEWDCTGVPNEGDVGILDIFFIDDDHGWAATRTAIWRTADGGDTWERLAP
jgi:photosystem II stability/assembly factor-like uncharacterized protein